MNGTTTRTGAPGERRMARALAGLALFLTWPVPAAAQLDPLLFVKRTAPNVLLVVDAAERMQRDANETYYDPVDYPRTGAAWEASLGVTPATAAARYRRAYQLLTLLPSGGDKFSTSRIWTLGDLQAGFNTTITGTAVPLFYGRTRMGVAKAAMIRAISDNLRSVRFGLIRTRQNNPRIAIVSNEFPVFSADPGQSAPAPTEAAGDRWKMTRPEVDAENGSIEVLTAPLVRPDAANANTTILTVLNRGLGAAGALLPAGRDDHNEIDAPVAHMLEDTRVEAHRLIGADTQCRNTIAVLITGGGEGDTSPGHDPAADAAAFLNVRSGRRVPIYVVAIAPPAADVAKLRAIAANSGGQYFEITSAMIDAALAEGKPVPEAVFAINTAVQHAFAAPTDFNVAPTAQLPYGPRTTFQTTSPIVGTVNLRNARSLTGALLPDTEITNSLTGAVIPQRANVMVTAGFELPGFEASLRAYRVYRPYPDATRPAGFRFSQDGTALWVARTPTATYCNDATASCRNIFTVLPDGTMLALTSANAGALSPYLNTGDPSTLINRIRRQPLGAIVSSTPAVLDPPSLDPPPDADYPAFIDANKDRRSLIFVGANDGMLHAIDARTGFEVWAFVPFNLLPKLRALADGQAVDGFDYFVDSSPKVADVKIGGQWRTYIFFGQGPGGTFYQALDVTLSGMAATIAPDADNTPGLLTYFSNANTVPFEWSFPRYAVFDPLLSTYGDISAIATSAEKTVGQTWSDPAVGQVESDASPFVMLAGSGFLPRTTETAANRGGIPAGRAFYVIDIEDGTLLDVKDVGSDNKAETVDNCALALPKGCTEIKNALQADPVATGPSDQRFITKAYLGDLDGNIWRFELGLDAAGVPKLKVNPLKLFASGADQPVFASMATVAVGAQQYLFFGTGSDLLPSTAVNGSYKLMSVLDQGPSGISTFAVPLAKVDGLADDEKVSAFPAVAGDIVFFSTTAFKPTALCSAPDAALYALTFVGGAAYDSTGDNKVGKLESPKVRTLVGAGRATAPFVVDQHLVFGTGTKLSMFGDPNDFNNGVGQVGVRILSWRELR